jgi:hypothetical protein
MDSGVINPLTTITPDILNSVTIGLYKNVTPILFTPMKLIDVKNGKYYRDIVPQAYNISNDNVMLKLNQSLDDNVILSIDNLIIYGYNDPTKPPSKKSSYTGLPEVYLPEATLSKKLAAAELILPDITTSKNIGKPTLEPTKTLNYNFGNTSATNTQVSNAMAKFLAKKGITTGPNAISVTKSGFGRTTNYILWAVLIIFLVYFMRKK